MKLKSILIGVLSLLVISLDAQNINQDQFDKAVDYFNCIVNRESSLKRDTNAIKKGVICNCVTTREGKSEIQKSENLPLNNKKLFNEINTLKNKYTQNLSKDSVIKLLTKDIFNDSTNFKEVVDYVKKRTSEGSYNSIVKTLNKGLNEILGSNKEKSVQFDSTYIKRIEIFEEKQKNIDWKLTLLLIAMFLFLLAFIAVFIKMSKNIIGKSKKGNSIGKDSLNEAKQNKEIEKLITEIVVLELAKKTNNIIENKNQRKNDDNDIAILTKEVIKKVEDKINEVQEKFTKQIGILQNKIENEEKQQIAFRDDKLDSETNIKKLSDNEDSLKQQKGNVVKSKIFYLPTPNPIDGSFEKSDPSQSYQIGRMVYKMTMIDETTANFEIYNEPAAIKLALSSPSNNILPVCDPINVSNANTKNIKSITAGKLRLTGNLWTVDLKAKISYM